MAQADKHTVTRSIIGSVGGVILAAFFVFGLAQPVDAQVAPSTQNPPHSLFSIALDKISDAVSRFRGALTGRQSPQRASESLAARKGVLTSVVEYLIDETEQAQQSLASLPVNDAEEKDAMAKRLGEDHIWFSGMLDGISNARAVSQLQTIADDVSQYRDQRHAILIRKISELTVAYKQRALVEIARARVNHIEADLASLDEEGNPTEELRASLANALEKIEQSSALVSEAIDMLVAIHSPYEENKYRADIEAAHRLLSQSSTLLREAYKIFIAMADAVK
jgi:hypothetical protein